MPAPLLDRRLHIAAPDPLWPLAAGRLIARIRHGVRPKIADALVSHIGSTAVPLLPAKEIIDLMLSVRTLEEADTVAGLLGAAGFPRRSGEWVDNARGVPGETWAEAVARRRRSGPAGESPRQGDRLAGVAVRPADAGSPAAPCRKRGRVTPQPNGTGRPRIRMSAVTPRRRSRGSTRRRPRPRRRAFVLLQLALPALQFDRLELAEFELAYFGNDVVFYVAPIPLKSFRADLTAVALEGGVVFGFDLGEPVCEVFSEGGVVAA